MHNYATRCSQWLNSNNTIDASILTREIKRFSQMLDRFEQEHSATERDNSAIDDILATLHLLQSRLAEIHSAERPQPVEVLTDEKPTSSFDWDNSALYQRDVKPEVLDEATRKKRLHELLQHDLIQKGVKKQRH